MKGASNVTLAQLIEAGVIEPGDQVLTVTVGGPGGTNTFIAGEHESESCSGMYMAQCKLQSARIHHLDIIRCCRLHVLTGMQACLGQISNAQIFVACRCWSRVPGGRWLLTTLEKLAELQICWTTGTSSTTASCSGARHRGLYMSSGWSTHHAWCVRPDSAARSSHRASVPRLGMACILLQPRP